MRKKTPVFQPEADPLERGPGRIARNRVRIAWMYYVEGLTQNEIADQLGIGRVTVTRNINEAIKQREVKIWIEGKTAECLALERELNEAFALSESVVVPEPVSPAHITKSIGAAAGMYMSQQLRDNMKVGVGWGATLYESLQTLSPRAVENLEVISLLGGIVQARKFNPAEFAWQFARIASGDCYLFMAPAVVDSPETKEALIDKCGLHEILDRAKQLDFALLSVGTMASDATAFRFNLIPEADRNTLIQQGAVGDIMFNFFNRDGELIDHPINRRVMSLPINQLRQVPQRLIASGGREKLACLRGALKLVQGNVLITNEETAKDLLKG